MATSDDPRNEQARVVLEMPALGTDPPPTGVRGSLVGREFGPYRIVSFLGAGGMGEVYRAHDAKLGRDVAIKTLPAVFARDPLLLARFHREARILASLNHPNIAAIYGLEEADGVDYLVLEARRGGWRAIRSRHRASLELPGPRRPRSSSATASCPTWACCARSGRSTPIRDSRICFAVSASR